MQEWMAGMLEAPRVERYKEPSCAPPLADAAVEGFAAFAPGPAGLGTSAARLRYCAPSRSWRSLRASPR